MCTPQIRHTGVVLAHGTQPDHKSKLLTELAVTLALNGTHKGLSVPPCVSTRTPPHPGFLVARYYCRSKEVRRVRDLEKTLDAVATSPFARAVERWALVGA